MKQTQLGMERDQDQALIKQQLFGCELDFIIDIHLMKQSTIFLVLIDFSGKTACLA